MSTSLFFSQLKTFCYEAEQDTKKVRKQVDSKTEDDIVDYGYLDDIYRDGNKLQAELCELEKKTYNNGSKDSHFSQVSVDEVHGHCQALFDANQQMIAAVEAHLQQFGYTPVPKLVSPKNSSEISSPQLHGSQDERSGDIISRDASIMPESGHQSPDRKVDSNANTPPGSGTGTAFESPVNIGLFREDPKGSKTPVLSEWKFSSSTKHLLTGRDQTGDDIDRVSHENSGTDDLTMATSDLSFSHSPSQPSSEMQSNISGRTSTGSSFESSLDLSPSRLDMSYDWSANMMSSSVDASNSNGTSNRTDVKSQHPSSSLTPVQGRRGACSSSPGNEEEGGAAHIVASPVTPQLDGTLKTVKVREPMNTTSYGANSFDKSGRELSAGSEDIYDTPTKKEDSSYSFPSDVREVEDGGKQGGDLVCRESVGYESDCSDPQTPELPELSISMAKYRVPFQRSVIKSASKSSQEREGAGVCVAGKLQYPEDEEDDRLVTGGGCEEGQDDGSDGELDFQEIETSTRLLQPRRAGAEGLGWVPLVSSEEWASAPSFLKMQVSVETLNVALQSINQSIEEVTAAGGVKKGHLESFSVTEIESVVGGNHVGTTPVKTIILGLVHLKRLDICTENCIKVYKVRRFY